MRYNFGVYHWRRRIRAIAVGVFTAIAGTYLFCRRGSRVRRLLAGGIALWGLRTGWQAVDRLIRPFPWQLDGEKYEKFASTLPLESADSVLDVGCGTGRSLVGIAAAIPVDGIVVGLDVFDDRIILGNGPQLAQRNAASADLDAFAVRGDAARLPLTDDSIDVVTACRVLHDLSAEDARRALSEAHRVCAPDGTLGVLELPITHGKSVDPVTYWRDCVDDAGFTVTTVRELDREQGRYIVVVGTP